MNAQAASETPTMVTRTCTVRFLTPAFLGDAAQNGRWRTPPFKHLLREWWRVAWAARNGPGEWMAMREMEGRLFGHAWLANDRDGKGRSVSARKSEVRMRLSAWKPGTMRSMPHTGSVARGAPAAGLYLGYGPVKAATELKMKHPVAADEQGKWMLAWPADAEGTQYLEHALSLIHWYGTLGGRSRNGWGSVALDRVPSFSVSNMFQPWEECLGRKWAHAIGSDGRAPLIWRSPSRKEWKQVIEDLGAIRKGVNGLANNRFERLVLNQPVGGKGDRVPGNLRFKVRRDEQGLYGVIYHMPFLPPGLDERAANNVWPRIHAFLDMYKRIPA